MIYRLTITLIAALWLLWSCNQEPFKTDSTGLEYMFINKNTNNPKPNVGDIVVLQMKYATQNDSLIETSPVFRIQLKQPSHPGGCIEDAIAMMHKSDSAEFKINTQNYFIHSRNEDVPIALNNSKKLHFYIKLIDIIPLKEFEKEQNLAAESNKRDEEAKLNTYLHENNITTPPLMSGLIIIDLKKGMGAAPTPGKKVTVHYRGSFLNGEQFDASYDRNKPFEFYYGIGKVIQGWDEGLAHMNVGGKYKLIIPSYLAYGNQAIGPIPPNSTLVFEIELLQAEK